jgi:hypothetical protein
MKRNQQPEVFRPKSGIELMHAISENRPCEFEGDGAIRAVAYLKARVEGDCVVSDSDKEGWKLVTPTQAIASNCRRWLRNQKS